MGKTGDRLAEVIRVDRLISREHVSAVAVAAAVHQGRVRVPCASSATLGNSTERVNGGLELHTHEFERPFLGPGSRSMSIDCRSGVGWGMQRPPHGSCLAKNSNEPRF